ncbi:60S ribosomal protein L13a-4 [Sesbania bispinosa]|nr:60S ribosomal protein L13a-4 [Sesbania bispinosa]
MKRMVVPDALKVLRLQKGHKYCPRLDGTTTPSRSLKKKRRRKMSLQAWKQ